MRAQPANRSLHASTGKRQRMPDHVSDRQYPRVKLRLAPAEHQPSSGSGNQDFGDKHGGGDGAAVVLQGLAAVSAEFNVSFRSGGGSRSCQHGRQRRVCKECGGASICEHGRQRSQCKECGGASFCEHGRRRRECKEEVCI